MTIGANILWQGNWRGFEVALGGPHMQLIWLRHKHGMMDAQMPGRPAAFATLLALF